MTEGWSERFLTSTRGRVVELLRHGEATVNELADALGLTDNAVRSHLTSLERDGLVRQFGKRPGVRKPEALYALTSAAEGLFPKSYHELITRLLDVISDRMSRDEIIEILREAGRAIASDLGPNDGASPLAGKIDAILDIVKELGGLAEKDENNERTIIGLSCPVGQVAGRRPEICKLIESLLTHSIGLPVKEVCDRSAKPRCIFEIG